MTCGQFNKLSKVEKNAALSWALGYISGMATSTAEEARSHHEVDAIERMTDWEFKTPELIAEIKRQCLERPSTYFPLIVEWTYPGP